MPAPRLPGGAAASPLDARHPASPHTPHRAGSDRIEERPAEQHGERRIARLRWTEAVRERLGVLRPPVNEVVDVEEPVSPEPHQEISERPLHHDERNEEGRAQGSGCEPPGTVPHTTPGEIECQSWHHE